MSAAGRTILMIASEAVPFAKTGGLADVAGALPLALARLGHEVTLVLPRYRGLAAQPDGEPISITMGGRTSRVAVAEQRMADRVRAVLLDCPELFDRDGLYATGGKDYADNARRFGVFVRAALETAARSGRPVDVVHAHDWQAGLAPVYLKTFYAPHPVFTGAASVFTIHNLAYQGLFPPEWLTELDLGWPVFTIDGLEFWGKISFLKAGVNFSNLVTTVSPTYADEIRTAEAGSGFDGILRAKGADLVGVLNGIDADVWNPATDPHIPQPFSADDLTGKAAAKRHLLESMGLATDHGAMARPLVGMVSRLVNQKGFDLLAEISDELMALDAAWVLLGSGEARYETLWRSLASRFPDRIGVRIGFDDALAHLIEAGADLFLMPSRFEPCGLNQMYSQRYGTIPVVRATGGLDDTVTQWNSRTRKGTGFKFRDATAPALLKALRQALSTFGDQEAWRSLQLAGMARDFSWDASAVHYARLYERAIRHRRQG